MFFLAVMTFGAFLGLTSLRERQVASFKEPFASGRVVVPASMLLVLYGGDRFLAANLETVRLTATGVEGGQGDMDYLVRAQRVVSELNSCHEDNYYLANGLLSWGGAVAEGNEILRAAMQCRTWDFMPAFFYGVNLAFFQHRFIEAERVLEIGAQRSAENSASLRKLGVMLRVEAYSDEKIALEYLTRQRDQALDSKLRAMLEKRVKRLEGLVSLRAAKRAYEKGVGKLISIQELVDSKFLTAIPEDPLGLGFELRDGEIVMKKIQIFGLGAPQ